jgi:magnesium-transporting ATPase (P-type)
LSLHLGPPDHLPGDHPKTAEAIARKINLIIGDTRESLAARTGREIDEVYEDEVNAVVVHGDSIDTLQGWQWDQSELITVSKLFILLTRIIYSLQ